MLTVNGRVRLRRVRWHSAEEGSQTPADRLLDEAERAINEGVREMACRLNRGAASFQQMAENLARAAHPPSRLADRQRPYRGPMQVCTQRLKGRGRRWDKANAEALMALDCLDSSHAWHLHGTNLDTTAT